MAEKAKDLGSHVKEVRCPRRRTPFSLVVAVDITLQIARGMEYLHAKGMIYHGELNPSNVDARQAAATRRRLRHNRHKSVC